MSKLEEFEAYVKKVKPPLFLKYQAWSPDARLGFETVLEKLQLDPRGMKYLDIGPGIGDTLDICLERGAAVIDFIDYDLFFYTYNRLKGFKGYRLNHLRRLDRLETGKYDLIWSKGSISSDFFNTRWCYWFFSLDKWLDQLDRISAPASKIIICPYWQKHNGIRCIKDVRNNRVTHIMLNHGYRILLPIENHNNDLTSPLTFLKDNSRTVPQHAYE